MDCGVAQGEPGASSKNHRAFEFDAFDIAFVVLTHAHQDHCGLIPKLYRDGFSGWVYCTRATARLARLALLDSVKYSGGTLSISDVEAIRFYPIDADGVDGLDEPVKVSSNIELTFSPSAHLVGACHVTIAWTDRTGDKHSMVMSGDIGNNVKDDCWQSLLAPRQPIPGQLDAIVVESTYGGRVRDAQFRSKTLRLEAIQNLISEQVIGKGLPLVMPAFAMQRTQEVLLDLILVIQRYFSGQAATQVANGDDPWFLKSIEKGTWTADQFDILTSTVSAFGDADVALWQEITEAFTVETAAGYRIKGDATAAYETLKPKLLTSSSPFQIDVVLSSPLALEMGRVLAKELCERPQGAATDRAYRNPSLKADFGLSTEEEVDALIHAAFTLEASGLPSPHKLVFDPEHRMPRRYLRRRRGTIFLTGGGMCDGGPVVGLLESFITNQEPFVFAPTGYLAGESLGGRLLDLVKSKTTSQDHNDAVSLRIGESQYPVSSVQAEVADLGPYYSGHADQAGLLDFVFNKGSSGRPWVRYPTRVFINHGNNQAREALKAKIEARIATPHDDDREVLEVLLPPTLPRWYDLDSGLWTEQEFSDHNQSLLRGLLRQQIQTNHLLKQLLHQTTPRSTSVPGNRSGKSPKNRKTA
ncbi:MAG: MBL fold metallo-hydrolase [Burkholderiaceae bacterium]|nr:MBL fold metallo-hydrolase [Burkholderiaceae bacterium]